MSKARLGSRFKRRGAAGPADFPLDPAPLDSTSMARRISPGPIPFPPRPWRAIPLPNYPAPDIYHG